MFNIIFWIFLAFSVIQGSNVALAQEITALEPFKPSDRVLILAPHPDDEAIGCAGAIQQARRAGAEIGIVYLTNGDNNELSFIVYEKRLTFRKGEFIHMGQVRAKEAVEAMQSLGVDKGKLLFLGYPDFGTFNIFNNYWQAQSPFKSMLTRVTSVPYKNVFSFGAPYTGESILNDLEKIILSYQPTKIFVSHPADINGDHQALYLFLQIALRELRHKISPPKVYTYLVHSLGWPKPRHYHPELNLEPPQGFKDAQIDWSKLDLTPEELEAKHQAILCYKSQTASSAFYLLSFARKNELFGDYPEVELHRQVAKNNRAPAYFGFSKMFASPRAGKEFPDEEEWTEGREEAAYALVDDYLFILVAKNKEFMHQFNLTVYLFGFSDKTRFASMPKIRILTHNSRFTVYDGRRIIEARGIRMYLSPDDLVLCVPLSILGNPDFILTAVRSQGERLSRGSTGFRKIVIK